MKSKKFISVFLIFLFFINAGDIEDAEINISAQRVDSNDLVISWSMNEVENLQNIVLEVLFENPENGQIENPLRFKLIRREIAAIKTIINNNLMKVK